MPFFPKNCNFCLSAPSQNCCHGNTQGYCQLKTISNNTLYILKVRKFHQPTANRLGTARKNL